MSSDITKVLNGKSDIEFTVIDCPEEFVPDGYLFICWNTKADGSGIDIYPSEKLSVQTDCDIYARWKQLFKIMDFVQEGNISVSNNVASNFEDDGVLFSKNEFYWLNTSAFLIILCITTGSDVATLQILLSYPFSGVTSYDTDAEDVGLYISIENGRILFSLKSGALLIRSGAIFAANTKYYVKIVWNGGSLLILYSTDGKNYIQAINERSVTVSLQVDLANICYDDINDEECRLRLSLGALLQWKRTVGSMVPVEKERTITSTVKEDHWFTNSCCMYADKDGRTYTYEQKLYHSTNKSVKTKNSCGYWGTIDKTVTTKEKYIEYEQHTTTYSGTISSFKGSIDLNNCRVYINDIEYRLRAV